MRHCETLRRWFSMAASFPLPPRLIYSLHPYSVFKFPSNYSFYLHLISFISYLSPGLLFIICISFSNLILNSLPKDWLSFLSVVLIVSDSLVLGLPR